MRDIWLGIPGYNVIKHINAFLQIKHDHPRLRILVCEYFSRSFEAHHNKALTVIQSNRKQASVMRNTLIQQVEGKDDIIFFTDDDCVPDPHWIEAGLLSLDKDNVDLVFGQTLPWSEQPNKSCPATFTRLTGEPSTGILPHWQYIGLSNNMAVRRSVFDEIGLFKPWLGPGSVGSNGEDAEFIIRCQLAGLTMGYNPDMLIFHDKWLTDKALIKQNRSYTTGGIAAYGYFYFQGVKTCGPIMNSHLRESLDHIKHLVMSRYRQVWLWPYLLMSLVLEISALIRGLLVALVFGWLFPSKLDKRLGESFVTSTKQP